MNAAAAVLAIALLVVGCSTDGGHAPRGPGAAPAREALRDDVPPVAPEDEGLDSRRLIELTEWIRDRRIPLFSVLVSRDGRLVYELYTSSLTRAHAHYQMSVTKSVVSALVGIAIDRGLIRGADAPITEALPPSLFAGAADVARFRRVTLRHVLGMSVLDASDPPRDQSPGAVARHARFLAAPNRVRFALEQPLLAMPGASYQYNDVTPMLATGALQYATGVTALQFADEHLFGPMGFRHHEWMHQDAAGLDLGGYGLRLRPIDMQKFGVLYLNGGSWHGRALVSRGWVERSFTPWNRSQADAREANYGWFWWAVTGRRGWRAHVANGWKGQRIGVLPRERLVVTMTGCIDDGMGDQVFAEVLDRFVVPAVGPHRRRGDARLHARLTALLEDVRTTVTTSCAGNEERMVPSVAPKSRRVSFSPGR
jgi:CubicO group peptidase (beta-lactamase class C family)